MLTVVSDNRKPLANSGHLGAKNCRVLEFVQKNNLEIFATFIEMLLDTFIDETRTVGLKSIMCD